MMRISLGIPRDAGEFKPDGKQPVLTVQLVDMASKLPRYKYNGKTPGRPDRVHKRASAHPADSFTPARDYF
jgi:hypothetical protein